MVTSSNGAQMTVIAWDGKIIAADKRAIAGNMVRTTTKLKRLSNGVVLATTGNSAAGRMLMTWFEAGADPTKWPECQKTDDWSELIVADAKGVWFYEKQSTPRQIEDPFMSWGCGADFARAAMHCGKTAKEAVEIASLYDNGCGNGVDVMELK